ncbi:MAG: NUDIX domain-containing protein [Sandaracinus sp.]|nr:NUDIX domain-containing protein [Sandaracinus sp.]
MITSFGLVLVRADGAVLLAHPGGPFFAKKDLGAWSIPKGAAEPGESPLDAALRETREELGLVLPSDPSRYVDLGSAKQSRKLVRAFGTRGDWDTSTLVSTEIEVDWPPRSGRRARFPEVDRAAFFALDEAERRVVPGQVPLLRRAVEAFPSSNA